LKNLKRKNSITTIFRDHLVPQIQRTMAEDPELDDLLSSVDAGASQAKKDDAELSQLLDSALKDFGPSGTTKSEDDAASAGADPSAAAMGDNAHFPSTASENDFPNLQDLLKGFADFSNESGASSQPVPPDMDFFKELMKEDPQMMGQFEQLAQAACQVDESENSQRQFSESLTSTLTALTQNMESLQSNLSEEEMMAALAGLNVGQPRTDGGELRDDISLDGDDDDAEAGANGPSPAFLPMLGGMMRSILSKEVLHPSLQEIANIYPSWLAENKETLSDGDYERFEKQYIIISEVCRDFEEETEASSEEDKQKRFERVLVHMQKMHELGQPPKELLLKLDPSLETSPGGVPLMPQMDQCNVM